MSGRKVSAKANGLHTSNKLGPHIYGVRSQSKLTSDIAIAESNWLARSTFHPLASVNPHDILERWASGDTLNQIAETYQVSPSAITRWLQRNASPEERELARELHYQTRLDTGLEKMEQAEDDVNLARAREAYLRRLEWRAATECKRWQQKPNTAVQINGSGEMQVQIVSYASNNASQHPSLPDNPSQQDS